MGTSGSLTITSGLDGGSRRAPLRSPCAVGRATYCDVVLDHPSVSRRHAELTLVEPGRWTVRDLGSRNGTLVNGVPVDRHDLREGDVIGIGRFELRFATEETIPLRHEADEGPDLSIGRLDRLRPPRMAAEHVSAVLGFGRFLQEAEDGATRLDRLLTLTVAPELGGWWAYAVRVSERGGELDVAPLADHKAGPGGARAEPHVSRTVLRTVLAGREPVLATNLEGPSRFEAELTMVPGGAAFGAVACPVRQHPDAVDVLYVILPAMLASMEWLMLINLAVEQYRHADAAWAVRAAADARAAMEQEMELARRIQSQTLPKRRDVGLDWAIRFEPSRAVAGDYVDVIPRDDGTVLLVIADASGKGVQAALITAGLHAIFHSAGRAPSPLPELIAAADRYLRDFLPPTSFVTLAAVVLDPRTGAGVSVNCGHPPLLAVGPGGAVRELLGGDNYPLGVAEGDGPVESVELALGRDEYLVGFTDGVSELADPDGRMLGIAGVHGLVARAGPSAGEPAAEALVERISASLCAYQSGSPACDDRTLLVARAGA